MPSFSLSAQPGLTGAGLLPELRQLIQNARHTMAVAVNYALTTLYWQIGVRIRKEILGRKRAEYGRQIVAALRRQLGWAHFKLLIPLKDPLQRDEQEFVSGMLESLEDYETAETEKMEKLRQQKHGLMHDLLTGRVRVKVDESANV